MLENLRRYIYLYLHKYPNNNCPYSVVKNLLIDYGSIEKGQFFSMEQLEHGQIMKFVFTNSDAYNTEVLAKSNPDFMAELNNEIMPAVDAQFPALKDANLADPMFWAKLMEECIIRKENDSSMVAYAKNQPSMFSMTFPQTSHEVTKGLFGNYSLPIYNCFENSPELAQESELMNFAEMFLTTMIKVYKERVNASTKFPAPLKEAMNVKFKHFEAFHCKMFNLPVPAEVEEKIVPYTTEELEQQKVWAEDFEIWWENEGQYHRAGGDDYCKTFAWFAWLNREQDKQKSQAELMQRIKQLEAQLKIAVERH